MNLIGNIENFTPGGNFELYIYRMEEFFTCNEIKDEKKHSLFITLIGPETFEVLCTLLYPDLPSKKTFSEIVKILKEHFKPKTIEIAESYRFYKREQKLNECLNDYIVELKMLAASCNFGEFLDRALRDKLVLGLRDERILNSLLNESELTFQKACDRACSMEMSGKEQKLIKADPAINKMEEVKFKSRPGKNKFRRSSVGSQRDGYPKFSQSNGDRKGDSFQFKEKKRQTTWICFICGRPGHIARFCRNSRNGQYKIKNLKVNNLGKQNFEKPVIVEVVIDNMFLEMEIDSGACISVISDHYYKKYFFQEPIVEINNINSVHVISGDKINIKGYIDVTVDVVGRKFKLKLTVLCTESNFTPIMGRDWLSVIYPKWKEFFVHNGKCLNDSVEVNLTQCDQIGNILDEIRMIAPSIIDPNNKKPIVGHEAEIIIEGEVQPKFCKAYSVPFHLREKVSDELDRLVIEGVLVPVKYSDWASPIVVVPKQSGEIRLCGDFKVSINKVLSMEHYPLPLVEDIFAGLANYKCFCVLDLSEAYQQLALSEQSKKFVTINTQKGLFQFQRLPFGVSSAPSIFQSLMDKVLLGLEGVVCYLDDILIGGVDLEDTKQRLKSVLVVLERSNIKINVNKCAFFRDSVTYLGHIICKEGLKPNPKIVEAVVNSPTPKNITEVESYLGLLNYYCKFVPNLSSKLFHLYQLKNKPFVWNKECQECFEASKKLLLKHNVLTIFDSNKPLIIACDASPYGVGAVLAHLINGEEKPIMFVSSTLTPAEKNYSQIHREALAVVFAVKRFEKYVMGKHFTIVSDHKPLEIIFSEKKSLPAVAAQRIQRWAIYLSQFDYTIKYRKGSLMTNADCLSRLPLHNCTELEEPLLLSFNFSEDLPLSQEVIKKETTLDKELTTLYKFLQSGWPVNIPNDWKYYYKVRESLDIDDQCIFYNNRIVIPKKIQLDILKVIHDQHIGVVRMKKISRSVVWWLGIDRDIENFVKSCKACSLEQIAKPDCENGRWPKTNYPFQRIHLDLFYFGSQTLLISIDDYSKWLEVYLLPKDSKAPAVISKLLIQCSMFGFPSEIVTDNGPPFGGREFNEFCRSNGIKLSHSPPYHPQSNGAAERAVRTVKDVLKKNLHQSNSKNLGDQLSSFLFKYRTTPSTVTSMAPSEIIFNYDPKTLISIMNKRKVFQTKKSVSFNLNKNKYYGVKGKFTKSKQMPKNIKGNLDLKNGQSVLYFNKNYHYKGSKWIEATVVNRISNFIYVINLRGAIRTVHRNQLKKFLFILPLPQMV